MTRRFYSKNRTPFWSRFTSCAVLGLYVFALVALPAWHGLVHTYFVESSLANTDSAPNSKSPIPEDKCPVCEFVRTAVPFAEIDIPLLEPAP